MSINLDIDKKTIKLNKEISVKDLHQEVLSFFLNQNCLHISFPFKIKKSNKKDCYFLVNGWTFEGDSLSKLSDKILMEKPEPPIVPSLTKIYQDKNFGNFIKLDDLLASVPTEIPNRSVHLYAENGNLKLKIGGVWPNPEHARQQKMFIRKFKEFEKSYKQYDEINKAI